MATSSDFMKNMILRANPDISAQIGEKPEPIVERVNVNAGQPVDKRKESKNLMKEMLLKQAQLVGGPNLSESSPPTNTKDMVATWAELRPPAEPLPHNVVPVANPTPTTYIPQHMNEAFDFLQSLAEAVEGKVFHTEFPVGQHKLVLVLDEGTPEQLWVECSIATSKSIWESYLKVSTGVDHSTSVSRRYSDASKIISDIPKLLRVIKESIE
jgi:hypothetical protein